MVPVLLAPRLLEVLPRETFRRTQLELQVIEISLLCLSLQVEITCINYTIKTKMSAMKISNINPHLPHQLALVAVLGAVLVGVGVLAPLDPLQHELAVLLQLLGPALHHHDVDVLVEDHRARHEQLRRVLLQLPLLGGVLQVLDSVHGDVDPGRGVLLQLAGVLGLPLRRGQLPLSIGSLMISLPSVKNICLSRILYLSN